jgi:hypothetical protein
MTYEHDIHTAIHGGGRWPACMVDCAVMGKEWPSCVPSSSHVWAGGGCASCVSAVRCGDPKGVGASTTRARYSRKRHRHINASTVVLFSPTPGVLPTSLYNSSPSMSIPKPSWYCTFSVHGYEFSNYYWEYFFWSDFYDYRPTPGAIGTLSSDIV